MARSGKRHESKGQRRRREQEAEEARQRIVPLPSNLNDNLSEWQDENGEIGRFVHDDRERTIKAYKAQSSRIEEDANHEHDLEKGGYYNRQVVELAQNAADAIHGGQDGRIRFHLTKDYFYCADNGKPIDIAGLSALLASYRSPKRGSGLIGRFGLGFKSVLGVSDSPEFFSRSGSFLWDRKRSQEELSRISANLPRYPNLRIAYAFNPVKVVKDDPILDNLMSWATNIVRLPLKGEASDRLKQQLDDFPSEFPLLVPHVSTIEIADDYSETLRLITCSRHAHKENDYATLSDGESKSRWFLASHIHQLSDQAKADARELDEPDEVRITWAVRVDRLNEPGQFRAYFPVRTQSILPGILNALWKTDADRQYLLDGIYNDELIEAAAHMVAKILPKLSTKESPAEHLDALPRRRESWDEHHAVLLQEKIYEAAGSIQLAPDQSGDLRNLWELEFPPLDLFMDGNAGNQAPDAFKRWQQFPQRRRDWLHHDALTAQRIFRLGLLWQTSSQTTNSPVNKPQTSAVSFRNSRLPSPSIAHWLEALTEQDKSFGGVTISAIGASKAAIETAALIPEEIRDEKSLGDIVLTRDGRWVEPAAGEVFLGGAFASDAENIVHIDLEMDPDTKAALEELGIRPADGAALFQSHAKDIVGGVQARDEEWDRFWGLARQVDDPAVAAEIINGASDQWHNYLRVKTIDGRWHTLHEALLPGAIVPSDGSRDKSAAIDTNYHEEHDVAILRKLGVSEGPVSGFPLELQQANGFKRGKQRDFIRDHKERYNRQPQEQYLKWKHPEVSGPLPILKHLSHEAGAKYTSELLDLDSTYNVWTIRHDATCTCHPQDFASPTIETLREHGKVEMLDGTIAPLADGLGENPTNIAVQEQLLAHPRAALIRQAFGIPDTPSILEHDDEDDEIDTLSDDVEEKRSIVREGAEGDAERLLRAVGQDALRHGLPPGLLTILEREKGGPLDDLEVAEAAISTFHTGALEEYRSALQYLDPPKQWTGGPQAVRFVTSLGFAEEWAGKRTNRRESYLEVDGPFTLPKLHDFQRHVTDNVRDLLRLPRTYANRRGMLSMPTGSGKTRVAVQAIVESIRDDGITSGILWVADRDELCEQAVQAWREVWASEGLKDTQLRISRLWQGQQAPLPVTEFHVVVASIQTLHARLRQEAYDFLTDFDLIVFDEAHRSIAPTSTDAMQDLGLTRYRRPEEPILIGLTATPYKGYDHAETQRLVNRYAGNRLDKGAFRSDEPEEVVRELQEIEVLARADHKTIQGGRFLLTDEEAASTTTFSRLPPSAEERIGQDAERTRRILDAYREHIDPDWPTLIFATSVEHSKIVAAMLNREGITARAVWGDTKPSVRRGIVEDFKNGHIQALVNYGVFREGFDAPKTRAIVVARPVYSPNLYFQMIGRGLRGVENGGNERCLILNVEDNIENYKGRLAFSELDWLWDEP